MSLFTTTLKESGLLKGFTEWHCHLLPGVDDGVRTMEESLQLLDLYEESGIREVWLTPHVMEDIPNTTEALKAGFEELKAAYEGGITLHLAAEYMLDNLFEERLDKGDLLPLKRGEEYLLVETSFFNPPMGLYDVLDRIGRKGFYAVLAHPERYRYMEEEEYEKLKERGIKFQLNLPSIVGMYGKFVQKRAEDLLRRNCYEIVGSDTHSVKMFQNTIEGKVKKKIIETITNKDFK